MARTIRLNDTTFATVTNGNLTNVTWPIPPTD